VISAHGRRDRVRRLAETLHEAFEQEWERAPSSAVKFDSVCTQGGQFFIRSILICQFINAQDAMTRSPDLQTFDLILFCGWHVRRRSKLVDAETLRLFVIGLPLLLAGT
jgi:hypothetical protein